MYVPWGQGCLLADTLDVLRTVLVHRKCRINTLLNGWINQNQAKKYGQRNISMNEAWKLFISKITKELAMRKEECSHSCRMGLSSLPKELYAGGRIFHHHIELRQDCIQNRRGLWDARVFRLPAYLCTSARPFPWAFNAPSSFIFSPQPSEASKRSPLTYLFLSPQAELAGFLPVLATFC